MVWKAGKLVCGIWLKVGRISFGIEITGGPEGLKVGILVYCTSRGAKVGTLVDWPYTKVRNIYQARLVYGHLQYTL